MRSFQFWILVLGSTLVSALMVKQIFLSRSINQTQRNLVESQQTAATATEYERYWKSMALHIYQASRTDPALAQVLVDSKVEIRSTPPATPATSAPTSSTPAKAPALP